MTPPPAQPDNPDVPDAESPLRQQGDGPPADVPDARSPLRQQGDGPPSAVPDAGSPLRQQGDGPPSAVPDAGSPLRQQGDGLHVTRIELHPDRYPTREQYPFNLPVLQQTRELPLETPVTLLVGENGTGKSTFIEAVARRSNIHIWHPPTRGRVSRSPCEEMLHRFLTVHWSAGIVPGSFFAGEIFQHFASLLDDLAVSDPGLLRYFGGRSLVSQSHGESLMSFFRSRYRLKGLYLLDEPETALSPGRQIELARLVLQMAAAGHAQFLIATHSPILLACPGARIYSFDHVPVRLLACEQTEHFRVYRDFMADPESHFDP